MRYIALFLITLNLAYLGWHLIRASDPGPEPVQSGPLLNTGLTLLSEFQAPVGQPPSSNNGDNGGNDQEEPRRCTLVAGFGSVDEARGFQQDARNLGLDTALRLTGSQSPPSYRVFLPPASGPTAAATVLDGLTESLETAGLTIETYLITRGYLENAISLGVFNQQENALGVQERVGELGYEPRIEEIPHSDGEIQVMLTPTQSDRLEDAEWLDLSAERPGLNRSENLCETIAQAP